MQIEGIGTFTKKGFHFDSGLPSNEPVLEAAKKLHGTMKITQNACVDFVDSGRVYLPPEVHSISSGVNYHVKRTSRNYIITVKVPVVESREDSENTINSLVPTVMGDITLDRKEILDSLSPRSPQ